MGNAAPQSFAPTETLRRRRPHPSPITPSTRQYIETPSVAGNYDAFFDDSNLFAYDSELLDAWFTKAGRLLDLGCGTGRHVIQFAERGFDVTGIDLSHHMLAAAQHKLDIAQLPVRLLHADILDLRRHVEPDSVDYACCMFSTFGLIAGARNRHRFLRRVRQVLRPGGLLALHAHSRGCNIFTAEGQRFLLTNAVATFRGRAEWGDKYLRWYRGIEDMFVHVFSRKELENALTRAGYTIRHLINLNHARNGELRPNLAATWRANGYLVLAEA